LQNKLVESDSYTPREDTFFLSDYLKKEKGEKALDIGTGTGYLANILNSKFFFVVATDINFETLKSQTPKIQNCICCESAEALQCKFDLIVCNPPYLPSEKIFDKTIDGGKEGVEIPYKIIKSVKKCLKKSGKLVFLTSSLANYQKLIEQSKILGLSIKIVARKKLFFEELILIEARVKEVV